MNKPIIFKELYVILCLSIHSVVSIMGCYVKLIFSLRQFITGSFEFNGLKIYTFKSTYSHKFHL